MVSEITRMKPFHTTTITMVFTLVMLGGCASKNVDMLHFLREHEHEVSAIEYRVGIPDVIGISAPRIVEIDSENQRIQPDGKINLRLLGEVKVVGMTAKEIAAKLEVLLGRYYVEPKVRVRVLAYASKKYYVHGQVTSPGPKPYTGRDTLLDAVLGSGVSFLSKTTHVMVTRPSHGEVPVRTLRVNVRNMLKDGDWEKNILLEPDDVVFVPPTPLAWVGLRIQEIIFPVQPVLQGYQIPLEFRYAQENYDDFEENRASGLTRGRVR